MTMSAHARIEDGAVTDYAPKATGEDHGLNAQGEALWRPVVQEPRPVIDTSLQTRAKTTTISPTEVRISWTVADAPLADIRDAYRERINDAAESARQQWITGGDGMAMTYQRKAQEAERAMSDPAPTAAKYPVLSASIGVEVVDTEDEASDLTAIAEIVLMRQDAFAQAAKAIEAVRLKALMDIGAASSGTEIKAIYEALSWPSL